MRNAPVTVPTLSVVLTTLRARSVIGPARSESPLAEPVYFPSVTAIVLLSLVVQVRVVTEPAVAENVAVTDFAVFAPSMPCATATLVATSAARPTSVSDSLRISSLRSWSAQGSPAPMWAPRRSGKTDVRRALGYPRAGHAEPRRDSSPAHVRVRGASA